MANNSLYVNISKNRVYYSEYIGYVFYMSSDRDSASSIVLKDSNSEIVHIFNERSIVQSHSYYHIYRAFFYYNVHTIIVRDDFLSSDLHNLDFTILIQYGFFSQSE